MVHANQYKERIAFFMAESSDREHLYNELLGVCAKYQVSDRTKYLALCLVKHKFEERNKAVVIK